MGYEELIKGLWIEADEKVKQLWNKAHADAGRNRKDAADRIDNTKKEYRKQLKNASGEINDDILLDTEKKSKELLLRAEEKLSASLYSLATECLPALGNKDHEKVFSELAGEIPPSQWSEVKVNHKDMVSAKELFPDSRIVPDSSITGGLEVHSENSNVCIANTLEKRLERSWEYLLPLIMQDVLNEVTDERIPSTR